MRVGGHEDAVVLVELAVYAAHHRTQIVIEMSAPNRAGILLPNNKANPSEDVLMLVMPVMLNN